MELLNSSVFGNFIGIVSLIIGAIGLVIAVFINKKIDNKNDGIKLLINNTKYLKVKWIPFSEAAEKEVIIRELEEKWIPCDFGVNSIREEESFCILNDRGLILLLEIYHGDPSITSPEEDSLALIIKPNEDEYKCLSDFKKHEQKRLYELKGAIKNVDPYFSVIAESIK